MSCLIDLPSDFLWQDKYNDYIDESIDNQIMDKIYFEEKGFSILEIVKFK